VGLTELPVGEILRPETPIEVFGLVPSPPAPLRDLDAWRADLVAPRDGSATNLVAKAIELGRVPLEAPDAKLLFPDLAVTHRRVFARFLLDDASVRERLGAPVLITLTSPARSHPVLWLGDPSGEGAADRSRRADRGGRVCPTSPPRPASGCGSAAPSSAEVLG
jgi:hypothetical protein